MKRVKQGLRNVYDQPPEETPQANPVALPPEILESALRRCRLLTVVFCTVMIVLLFALAGVLCRKIRIPAPKTPPAPLIQQAYVPHYTLPEESAWVVEYQRKISTWNPAGVTNPPLSIAWVKHAAYHLIIGQQSLDAEMFDKAIVHFEKALAAFPELHGVHALLGTVYLRQGVLDEAVEHLAAARKEQPTHAVLNNLGSALIATEQLAEAENVLLQARDMDPDHPGSYKNLALLYRKNQQHEPSLAFFDEYFARHDQDTEAMKLYAEYLITLEKRDLAVGFLNARGQVRVENAHPLYLLLAKIEATEQHETEAVNALEKMARHISPYQALTELNRQEFDSIRDSGAFQNLVRQVELAMVQVEGR